MHENSMSLYHRQRFVSLAEERCCIFTSALFICLFILMKGKCAEGLETTSSCGFRTGFVRFVRSSGWNIHLSPTLLAHVLMSPLYSIQPGGWSKNLKIISVTSKAVIFPAQARNIGPVFSTLIGMTGRRRRMQIYSLKVPWEMQFFPLLLS